MDVRPHHRSAKPATSGKLLKPHNQPKASDALSLPLYLTNGLFFTMFFSVMYFLLHRWREKIRNSIPLHVVTLSELAAILSLIASVIYLVGFFGIDFVQSIIRPSPDSWEIEDEDKSAPCEQTLIMPTVVSEKKKPPTQHNYDEILKNVSPGLKSISKLGHSKQKSKNPPTSSDHMLDDDDEIVKMVVRGTFPSYALETKLGDCNRAAAIRREAVQRITGKSLSGLPLDGFDYESILGQCCEMPVGYVQIPVGIAGPLLLNGNEFFVPMATTEGCLVASTNRGCKAVYVSGGASCVVVKDGMTRAPVVRFGSAKRAAELKMFLEDPLNFEALAVVFNKLVSFMFLFLIKIIIIIIIFFYCKFFIYI
ncbi:putative hydroxymethylglutaryl-CoA reductase (NADPH) [Helianthus anomalus]